MKRHPFVSVIVPTKNEEKVIGDCLRSLAVQRTTVDYEVLVVDTASSDATLAIANEYPVRIIHEPRKGRNIAHQSGVDRAKGTLLCFTEADCQLPPTWIETIAKAFETNPNSAAVVGRYVFTDSTPLYEWLARIILPIVDTLFRIIHGHYCLRATNFAIRKAIVNDIGGFNPLAREFDDVELGMRVARKHIITYVPSLVVSTRDRRIAGRIIQYLREVLGNYMRTVILRQVIHKKMYADIR